MALVDAKSIKLLRIRAAFLFLHVRKGVGLAEGEGGDCLAKLPDLLA